VIKFLQGSAVTQMMLDGIHPFVLNSL